MIDLGDFFTAARPLLRRPLNPAQIECIGHDDNRSLLIVAGPGSGKTTVLILRALRHVFVDDEVPDVARREVLEEVAALRRRHLEVGEPGLDDRARAVR